MISVVDLAVVSLQKIKLASFEEHFEAKVCYVLFVVQLCELYMVSLKTTSCSTLCQLSRDLAGLQGSREHSGMGTGEAGREEN